MTTTKSDLTDTIAAEEGVSKTDVGKVLNALPGVISAALQRGEEVRYGGLGTFSRTERAASEGRNPRTGEPIQIAASKQAKFKPGKRLRDSLNS